MLLEATRRMVSIQTSINDLEIYIRERDLAVECYLSVIRNLAHYAVDPEDQFPESYRLYLLRLTKEIGSALQQTLNDRRDASQPPPRFMR